MWKECRKFLEFEMAAVRGATMSIRVKEDKGRESGDDIIGAWTFDIKQ